VGWVLKIGEPGPTCKNNNPILVTIKAREGRNKDLVNFSSLSINYNRIIGSIIYIRAPKGVIFIKKPILLRL
jgi:hypothetical protein